MPTLPKSDNNPDDVETSEMPLSLPKKALMTCSFRLTADFIFCCATVCSSELPPSAAGSRTIHFPLSLIICGLKVDAGFGFRTYFNKVKTELSEGDRPEKDENFEGSDICSAPVSENLMTICSMNSKSLVLLKAPLPGSRV